MTYNIYDENDNIKVLVRNAVKCLVCDKIIESKYQHNFVCCGCKNETCVDGGLVYQRVLGKDLDKIENLCEYKTYSKVEYEAIKEVEKIEYERVMQERVASGEVIKIGGTYHNVKVLQMLVDKGAVDEAYLNKLKEKAK